MTTPQSQGRERRLHARYRVDLGAEIQGTHGLVIHGRVRDICSGGLFLELELGQVSDCLRLGEQCHIHIALPDGRESARALAEIVRLTSQGFGLRFMSLLDDTQVRLSHFIGQTLASTPLDEQDEPPSPLDHSALRLLRDSSLELLPRIFDRWVEYLVEALWKYSETAESDSHRSLTGSEIGLLSQARQSGRLALQMRDVIHESLGDSALAATSLDEARSELALLDQDEFEDWLVKSELNARLEQALREPLGRLRLQAAQLPGRPLRPIEPDRLIDSLENGLSQVGLSSLVLRIGLRSAGHQIAGELANFYHTITQGWSRLGIEGIETASWQKRVIQPNEDGAAADPWGRFAPPAEPQPESAAPEEPTAPPVTPPSSRDTASTVTQVAPASPAASAPSPNYPQLRELFENLRAQAKQTPAISTPRVVPLQRWLSNRDTLQGDPLALPRTHERVALTERLVTDILTDGSTPSPLKTVLERIPAHLLSMAVTHPGALLDEQHPLVRLLDRIERLARLLPNGARDDAEHQQAFERLIERLVATEADDVTTLDALSTQLDDLNERLDRQSRSNRAHWVSVCEIRERHRKAREAVRRRINRILTDHLIHPVVIEVLDRGWRTLLETVCLASGLDSPRWRRHWRTLWQLHLDTHVGYSETDGSIETERQSVLFEELLDGWGAIGLTPEECTELTDHVRQVLEQTHAGQVEPECYRPFTPLSPAPDDGPDSVAKTIAEADWNAAGARIDALPLGALAWSHEREGPVALRLIWRSQDGSRLGLTDPLGKRLISLRRSHLIKKLLREQLVIDRAAPEGSVQRAATVALERMQSRIHEHDLPDPLTGLANQHRLRGALVELLADQRARDRPYVLGFLELDRFDLRTSQYGFAQSEQILKAGAELLLAQLPEARCLAYLGGGRFGVLTAIADDDEALALGERLHAALGALPFAPEAKPGARRFSWSLGLSRLDGHQAMPEHYLSAVNLACLAARRQGGDRVVLFRDEDPLILEQLEQLRVWAQAEDAIRSERIRLRFQPIAPLAELDLENPNQGVHHSEILLSVYDENHQPLHLGDFIAAAEALNMMRTLDHQVIEATFRWLCEHPERDGPLGSVAINVSGQTIGDADFVTWVGQRLEHWAIPTERVGFEVTETAAIVDIERAAANLAQLKALGCSLYLDDFGSGLSSYGYLKRLPVDYVKIDGSFIKDIVNNPHDQAIVRSFNEIAHFMGKQTVAEFVENAGIIALLREIGIDHVQGYAIARPGFIDEFVTQH